MKETETASHYDEKYFSWQKEVGEFGAWANITKFEDYISKDDKVVDFGCGSGFLLKAIDCKEKIGVELNEVARNFAKEHNQIQTVASSSELADDYYDIIISNHALEHCFNPYLELKELYKKLKSGGQIIFVVPHDGVQYRWSPNDANMHLYSWSPMNLGNLFTTTGFEVVGVHSYIHKWPPNYKRIAKYGRKIFDMACRFYGRRTIKHMTQTRVVAKKP